MKEFFQSVRKKDALILFFAFIVLIIIDQYTKYLTVTHLDVSESKKFIEGFLQFTYVRNKGASFGMLQGQRIGFIVLTCVLFPIMVFVYLKISVIINICKDNIKTWHFTMFGYGLLLMIAGTFGNFIDRIRLSYVVDFLDLQFIDFPVFNMADCYITVGTIILIVGMFVMSEKELDYIIKSRKKW